MNHKIKIIKQEAGFTIVELMIALAVFSTILVIGTVLMIQIGNLYTKGINGAGLQNATRNVMTDVTSAIEFSGGEPSAIVTSNFGGVQVNAFCVNKTRFSFVLAKKLGQDINDPASVSTPHVLWRDTISTGATCKPLNITNGPVQADSLEGDPTAVSNGYEMLPENVRLNNFDVTQTAPNSGVYKVEIWTSYGDRDLLVSQGGRHYTCTGDVGTQFCAVSELTTEVSRRVE